MDQIVSHIFKTDRWFRHLFELSPDPTWIIDDGRFVECNDAAVKALGYASRDELLDVHPSKLSPTQQPDGEDSFSKAERMMAIARGQGLHRFEWVHTKADGTDFDAEVTLQVINLGERSVIYCVWRDITERKRMQRLIEKRIATLTQPVEGGAVAFDELFDLIELQRIQDEFASATGVASLITRPDGTAITNPSNFTRLCSEIIRNTEKGCANCIKSDAAIGRFHPAGPIVQPCLSGGLWDAGASITLGGKHIANWLIGQVRDETQTDESMRSYARTIGADEQQFMNAFHEVPAMSREQFERVARALFTLANQLSVSAYQNVQQARYITERQQTEEALRASEARFRSLFEQAAVGVAQIDTHSGRFLAINRRYCEIVGYGEAEMLLLDFQEITHPDDLIEDLAQMGRLKAGEIRDFKMEKRYFHKDGHLVWVELTVSPMRASGALPDRHMAIVQDITRRKEAEQALERLAHTDALTGLANRGHFLALAESELARSIRYTRPVSVLMIDADLFKNINDRYGHAVGDAVLKRLADVFRETLREVDLVGRFGGEEFAVLLPETDHAVAIEVAERLRQTIEASKLPLKSGLPLQFTVSVGVTSLTSQDDNLDVLLSLADTALYQAKRSGRNKVCSTNSLP